jgi:hypothetical protein
MTVPGHKLFSQPSNKRKGFLKEFEEDLEAHFEELRKEAEPIVT